MAIREMANAPGVAQKAVVAPEGYARHLAVVATLFCRNSTRPMFATCTARSRARSLEWLNP